MLLRAIHNIFYLSSQYLTKKIWIRKEDLKYSYRIIYIEATSEDRPAIKIIIYGINDLLVLLRLTFYG